MSMMRSLETPEPSTFLLEKSLAHHALFDVLLPDQLAWIADQAVMQTFHQGEMIFLEGDVCQGLRVIETGSIKIFKLNPEGAEHIGTGVGKDG